LGHIRISQGKVKDVLEAVLGFEPGAFFKHLFHHGHAFDHRDHFFGNGHKGYLRVEF
jgi:hypothetical protein